MNNTTEYFFFIKSKFYVLEVMKKTRNKIFINVKNIIRASVMH